MIILVRGGVNMSDDKKAEMMREFVKAFESNDLDKLTSLCTDDIVMINSIGTFSGKEGLKHYVDWLANNISDLKIAETGNGILVQGDKAFFEHTFSGTMQGEKAEFLAMCAYEFSDEKIKTVRTIFDRLSIAEQASSKWIEKKIVNNLVSQMQKGL